MLGVPLRVNESAMISPVTVPEPELGNFILDRRNPLQIFGFALWFSEIYRKDMAHLVYGSPILVILCFRLYSQLRHGFYRCAVKCLAISGIILVGFNGLVAFIR
jgi:hypothetical protein